MKNFHEYSEKHVHFIEEFNIPFLEKLLRGFNKPFSIVDLGCGDGRFIYSLYKRGLLNKAKRVVGVDISKERIDRLKEICPFTEGLVADVTNLKELKNNSFDIAISSQVIEHVSDDKRMLKEVYRILKPKGYFYVSTVIKKWYGFWIYWNGGFKLDPTHKREYSSEEEFINLLENNGFQVLEWRIERIRYPFIDLMLRFLIYANIIEPTSNFYVKHSHLEKLRKLKLGVIGYRTIEVLSQVRK
jgi:ubiquinone/menaquinone biosynthesis C-methylase UbiE